MEHLPLNENVFIFFRDLTFYNFTQNLERYAVLNNVETLNEAALCIFEQLNILPRKPIKHLDSPKCLFCPSLLRAENKTGTKLGWVFRCRSKSCRKSISPTMNTLFERAFLDFLQVLKLIFSYVEGETVPWARRHVRSSSGIKIAKDTIIEWYKYFNGVCQMMNSVAFESQTKAGAKVSNNVEKRRWDRKFACRSSVGVNILTFLCHVAAVYRGPFGTPPNILPKIPVIPAIPLSKFDCNSSETESLSEQQEDTCI